MNIIIVGSGKVGTALAAQLSSEGHNITMIDSDAQALSGSGERLDVMTLVGNGAAMATLREAGVEKADVLVAATNSDELNLLCCMTARKLGAKRTIVRVRNPEYAEQLVVMQEELGLSLTVNPEMSAALEAYHLLQFPSFLKRESFAKGRVEIVGVPVEKDSRLVGIPMRKLYEIAGVNVLVCAVVREDGTHIPSGDFTIEAGDTLFVTADMQDLAALVRNLGLVEKRIRSILIVGGSRIAFYLAHRCLASGISVKIIERDHERCLALAEYLPKAVIIEADGSRQDVLMEEGFKNFDAVITLTGMDEENLVLSMLASHLGVPKVISKVNRVDYADVFRNVGVGSTISPKGICCANIARYVRAMSTAEGSDSVVALHTIVDGQVEALEFRVGKETRHQDEKLMDIPLKEGILIACITRRGKTVIPKGDSSFATGDTVIVVTAGGRAIKELEDIFSD